MAATADQSGTQLSTAERLLLAARRAFATRGFAASSLDEIAADCDVRKQTLLYHFPSKDELLDAVIDRTVADLTVYLDKAVAGADDPRRAVVDSLFRVGTHQPELLEIIREVLRLGPPASTRLLDAAEPDLDRLSGFVTRERVLRAGAIVLGMATEADALASVGVEPTIGDLRRRRRVLLDYLSG